MRETEGRGKARVSRIGMDGYLGTEKSVAGVFFFFFFRERWLLMRMAMGVEVEHHFHPLLTATTLRRTS